MKDRVALNQLKDLLEFLKEYNKIVHCGDKILQLAETIQYLENRLEDDVL